MAPVVFGLGLLEAIPEETILAYADEMDVNGDGISGNPILCGMWSETVCPWPVRMESEPAHATTAGRLRPIMMILGITTSLFSH